MSKFLARYDLLYEAAPERWEDGLPLGNGSIGAVIWGDGAPLKITLDSCDLWDLRTPRFSDARYSYAHFRKLFEAGRISEIKDIFDFRRRAVVPTRLPPLRFELSFGRRPVGFEARLGLSEATASGKLLLPKGAVRWEAYVAASEDVLLLRVSSGAHPRPRLRPRWDHLSASAVAELRRRRFPSPRARRGRLYQEIPGNGGYIAAWRRLSGPDGGETFLVTILKGQGEAALAREAKRRLDRVARDLAGVRRAHLAWWSGWWRRSCVGVPDTKLEAMYYAEMYKLGCNARADARLPVALHGVWSPDGEMPPWHGDFHLDYNLQTVYLPVYAANRLEAAAPFYDWAERLLPVFRKECRRFFGCGGAFAPCAVGPNGERVFGYETCEQWPGNGAWLAHLFWLHYRYTGDRDFLRARAYPFLREFMRLYAGILEKGPDGRWHIPLGCSPEYGEDRPEAWGRDPSGDLALVRFLASALLESVEELGLEEPEAPTWRDMLENLAPYPTLESMTPERRRAWLDRVAAEDLLMYPGDPVTVRHPSRALFVMHDVPYDFTHRHLTHLLGVYPLDVLTVEDGPEAREAIRDSLDMVTLRGESAWASLGTAWMAALAARARRGGTAARLLREHADYYTSANTFPMNADVHEVGISRYRRPVMTLEGGFGAAAALTEMLLQSWHGIVRVFPAVPAEWTEVGFERLRAEGAFIVSARMEKGDVSWVEIESEKGGPCCVENVFGSARVTLEDLAAGDVRAVGGRLIRFQARPGGRWLLYARRPETRRGLVQDRPMAARTLNPFGVKRRNRLSPPGT